MTERKEEDKFLDNECRVCKHTFWDHLNRRCAVENCDCEEVPRDQLLFLVAQRNRSIPRFEGKSE